MVALTQLSLIYEHIEEVEDIFLEKVNSAQWLHLHCSEQQNRKESNLQ